MQAARSFDLKFQIVMRSTLRLFSMSRLMPAVALVLGTAIFGVLVLVNPMIALFVGVLACVTPVLILLVAQDALRAVLLALLLLPFHNSPLLNPNLMGIQGMKPFNLLAFTAIASGFFYWLSHGRTTPYERRLFWAFAAYFLIWTVEFVRSLANYDVFRLANASQGDRGISDYLLSFYVRPSLFALLFIVVLALTRSGPSIRRAVWAISLSMFLMSCAIFLIALGNPGEFSQGRDAANPLFETYLGLHYNTIGTMFIVTGPLILYSAFERGWLPKISLACAFVAVLLIGSRSALIVFVFAGLATLLVSGQKRAAFTGLAVIGTTLIFAAAPSVSALFSVGVGPQGGLTVDGFVNARQTLFWGPLLQEWWHEPVRFWLGSGLYGMLTSTMWSPTAFGGAMHAHNGIINFFLDSGAILTIVLLTCLTMGVVAGWRLGRQLHDRLYWALFFSLVGYLIATLTERGFYPNYDNVHIFPVLALIANVAWLGIRSRMMHRQVQASGSPSGGAVLAPSAAG